MLENNLSLIFSPHHVFLFPICSVCHAVQETAVSALVQGFVAVRSGVILTLRRPMFVGKKMREVSRVKYVASLVDPEVRVTAWPIIFVVIQVSIQYN